MASATFTATFTAAGTFPWVAPAGVTSANVQCTGGGSGASGSGSHTDGGGGGGEYAAEPSLTVSPGTSYAVVVGAGGAAGGFGSAGGPGGDSTFGSAAVVANGAVAAAYGSGTGPGGTGSSNTVHFDGGAGGFDAGAGGGGGGSGGSGSAGNSGANSSGSAPGAGGSAVTGGGPGGNGGASSAAGSAPSSGPGGGGGGAGGGFSSGGAGAPGQVVITWTMNTPAVIAASTAGGVYQWTAPAAVTSVSWTITGTAAFGGNSSSGSESVTPGDLYTISAGSSGSLTVSWTHPVSDADTVTGTDAGESITASVSSSDTVHGTDSTGIIETPVSDSDTVHATDAGESVSILIVSSDTVHGTDAAGPAAATLSSADTVTAADYVPPVLSYVPWVPGPVVHPISYPSALAVAVDADTVTGTDAGEDIDPGNADTVTGTDGGEDIVQYGNFPSELPLQMVIELLINGTWTDITDYVLETTNIVITRGQPDETQAITASSMTMVLDNRTGNFTPKNALGTWYGYIGRNTQIRLSAPDDGTPPYDLVYRFWGEVSAWPPAMDATGAYQVVNITASGIWRRLGQNTATIGSPLTRYYSQLTGAAIPVGYWPCEDPSSATQFASGLPGGDPMAFIGSPSLASDAVVGGSDALPSLNGSEWAGTPGSYLTPGSTLYATPGTYSYTAPGGITSVTAEVWGSGGGGAGSHSPTLAGGGAGGGEYAKEAALPVTPGNSYNVVVAAGGAGGVPGSNGGAGANSGIVGDSSTEVIAHGGGAGRTTGGGTGGTGSSNTVHHNGGAGAANGGGGGGYASFSSSGTWDAPAGVTSAGAYCYGGGGSGGGSEHFYYGNGAGGGGGGGGGASGTVGVTGGSSYPVTVGQGGAAASGVSSGNAGGASSFAGDSDTITAGGGAGGQSSSVNGGRGNGGAGGSGGSSGSLGGLYDGGAGGNGAGGGGGGPGGNTTGAGNPGGAYGGGGGGAGTPQATGPSSSGAGGGGFVELSYSAPTLGAGGGGSGGNTSAGNTATTGAGATAVTDGGPGGNGGSSSSGSSPLGGPGGGGGGGDAGSYAGGSGAAGQVLITTSASTTPTANVTRFVLGLDASGSVDGTVIAEIDTSGTVAKLQLVYHTGGELELLGFNGTGGSLFDSGAKAVTADGLAMMVSVELDADGSDVEWKLQGVVPAASSLAFSYSGTVTGSMGSVTEVKINPGGGLTSSTAGQVSVQYAPTSLLAMAPVLAGYAGELAADRFLRLLDEEGITGSLEGTDTDTGPMGPQTDATLTALLQECATMDCGFIFEPRDSFGLSYRTLANVQNQSAVAIMDFSLSQLAQPFQPTEDDQNTRNYIVVSRGAAGGGFAGSTYIAELPEGALSVQAPPNGVGQYSYQVTVNCQADTQLAGIADQILAVGTVDEMRYPVINVDLTRPEVAGIFTSIISVDSGDFIEIDNALPQMGYGPIRQLALGFTETLNNFVWTISWNCVPESPYET